MICVYCQNEKQLSREHIISNSVLQIPFGRKIINTTTSEIFNGKLLKDYSHKIKDVCAECNSKLSNYDIAGKLLVSEVNKYIDLSYIKLKFGFLQLGWIIKTHLNFIRLIPDRLSGQFYIINPALYQNIIAYKGLPQNLYCFLIEGWEGKDYFWDENDERKIQYFQFKSILFPEQKILVSNFRIKSLDTFILLPSDNSYEDFEVRCKSTRIDMKLGYDINPTYINISSVLKEQILIVDRIVKYEELKKHIYQYR